ncbi:MAG: hypothetical protein ACTSXQ_06495 [Alphaproteobacteria bacterium]
MKKLSALQKTTTSLLAVTILTHLFCCGIPMVANILAFLSVFGLTASSGHSMHFFHYYQQEILIFATAVIVFSGVLQYISWRIDCKTESCKHAPCTKKKKQAAKLFWISLFLYLTNLIFFLLGEHLLEH